METSLETLYILDSYGLIYREFYAFFSHPLTNSKGENVSAVYGFFRNLFLTLKKYNPKYIVAAFDSRTPTFRHELYKDYKANRQETPAELKSQFPLIEKGLELLGIPVLRCDGFEADDIIATLARNCEKNGNPCRIFSADKDLMQLVCETTHMLKPDKDKIWAEVGINGVEAEWGVKPEKMLDLLSLTGDTADNVPGVKGIGVKTGVKLLSQYGTLEGIYEHAQEIKGALGEKIRRDRENAFFSKKLIELRYDVPVQTDYSAFEIDLKNESRIDDAARFFKEVGVPKIASELNDLAGKTSEDAVLESSNSEFSVSKDESKKSKKTSSARKKVSEESDYPLVPLIPIKKVSGNYSEIKNVSELRKNLLENTRKFSLFFCKNGFAFSKKEGESYFVKFSAGSSNESDGNLFSQDLFGGDFGNGDSISKTEALKILEELFENPQVEILCHDAKSILKECGVKSSSCSFFDTMIAAWVMDPDKTFQNSFELDFLAEKNLALIFSDDDEADEEIRWCEKATVIFSLRSKLSEKLEKYGLSEIFFNMEMKVLAVLSKMEIEGIHLDPEILSEYKIELNANIADAEKEIYQIAGHEFNISSPKQLGIVLFEELGLRSSKKTKTGYSTDSAVLEELAQNGEVIAEKILAYRSYTKLLSTYVEPLMSVADENSRVHTTFVQTGTATGRLSSKEPNLQNIPVREESGRRIRSAFVAEDGKVLISADYAQIELVVLAHLSEDKNLCDAFNSGVDVHKATASLIYSVPPENVTAQMRRNAKTINFGVMYGMGAFSLGKDLGIPFSEAQRFISDYFRLYSGVKALIDKTIADAEETGCTKTMFGRKRKIPNINSTNHRDKEEANRLATNTPIQGTAADIVKKAMLDVSEELEKNPTGAKLLLQVHDELIFECPDNPSAIEKTVSIVKEKMENAVKLKVPLRVSIEYGKSWGNFH